MPVDWSKYPKNWASVALSIKNEAQWQCECCGKQCRLPGEPFDTHKNTLTVMHLDHNESNIDPGNLLAGCAPCHLRYDAKHHAKNASATRRKKLLKNQRQLWE